MRVTQVRNLAVEVARTDAVHVSMMENQYGWHVIVYAGQPVDCSPVEEGDEYAVYQAFSTFDAPVMATGSAPSLDTALSVCFLHLTELLVKQES